LQKETSEPDFWQDERRAREIMKKLDSYQDTVDLWEKIEKEIDDLLEMAKLVEESKSEESKNKKENKKLSKEIENKVREVTKKFLKNEFQALMDEKYDRADAIVAIHAGAGGVDAQDWAEMLLRMYLRYAEGRHYKTNIVHISKGEEAGIKSVTFEISGSYAYGYLKTEAGVHRLVRLSPFNADHLRQTSFALVEVLPEISETDEIKIKPEDLKIDTFRASGAGGQHVNKTDSAVRITHIPTKLSAACQTERSQAQNKETALKILKAKLYQKAKKEEAEEKQKLRGEYTSAEWGNQIRSYVLHPYKLVKDHRTNIETTDAEKVLDGNIGKFIEARLKNC